MGRYEDANLPNPHPPHHNDYRNPDRRTTKKHKKESRNSAGNRAKIKTHPPEIAQKNMWSWEREPLEEYILENTMINRTLLRLKAEIDAKDIRPSFTWNIKAELKSIAGTSPPRSGNWTISDVTVVEGSTLIINGSIIVNETGALILRNSKIYMNLTSDGEHWIDVYGNLTVLGSLITAYHTANNYYIRVFSGAKLRIEDSEISYAGYEWGQKSGLWINTENAAIRNNTIHNNYYGICLYKANNTKIMNNTIQNNRDGVDLPSSSGNSI